MASIPGGMAVGCYDLGTYFDNGLAPLCSRRQATNDQ